MGVNLPEWAVTKEMTEQAAHRIAAFVEGGFKFPEDAFLRYSYPQWCVKISPDGKWLCTRPKDHKCPVHVASWFQDPEKRDKRNVVDVWT